MITTAAKFWFAVAGLAFVAGLLYAGFGSGEWYGSAVLGKRGRGRRPPRRPRRGRAGRRRRR